MTKKKIIINTIVSAFLILSLSINYNHNSIFFNNIYTPNSIFWVIIFFLFVILINSCKKIYNKKLLKFSLLIGSILSLIYIIGHTFTYYVLYDVNLQLNFLVYLLFKLIGYAIIATAILMHIYYAMDNYNIMENKKPKIKSLFEFNKKNFLIVTLIILLAYIPWFFHYYPGICSSDSTLQMLQMVSKDYTLTNHHPVLHTLIIGLCLKIGMLLFKSNMIGVALYSILQMIACSVTFAYVIFYCGKKNVPLFIREILMLFFMFCPIIASYSVTMWKDIPFALSILITTTMLIDLAINPKEFLSKKKNLVLLTLFFILDIFFRKNGLYCVILTGIVYFIILSKKEKILFSIVLIIPLILNFIVTGPIFEVLSITEGNSKEAFSIPMQLFARVRKYHSDELTKKEKKELDAFFYTKDYIEQYDPVFADPVKRIFSEEYLQKHKKELVFTYFKFSKMYPLEAVKSIIAGSYGYYYPDLVGWEVFHTIYSDETTKVLKVEQKPIHKFIIINKLEFFLNNHNISLLSMLTSCGFYFWLLLIVIGYLLYKSSIKILPSISLLIGVWGTALLSPVFCERRYVYSMFLVVPLLLVLCFKDKKIKEKSYRR